MIQKEQVIAAQNEWGSGVVAIGALRDKRAECEAFASNFLDKMYAFDLGTVLFKPTKCAVEQFRATKGEAQSYLLQVMTVLVRKTAALPSTLGPRFASRTPG